MTAVVFQLQHLSLLLRLIAVTLDDRPNISSVSSLHCMKRSDVDVAACVMDLLCRVSIVHSLLLEIETFCCHTYTNIIYATEHGHQR